MEQPPTNRDPRMELIAMTYRLHGAMRSLFAGPPSGVRLVLLEALALGTIVTDPEPPTVSQVGQELGYSRQSVQRAVNKLVELGLVERQENPRHKRAPVFVPTPEGVKQMSAVQASSRQLAQELRQTFSDSRTEALLSELRDLATAIGAFDRQRS